jgi:hypothetical protein
MSDEWKLTFVVEKALICGRKRTKINEGAVVGEREGCCSDLKAREEFQMGLRSRPGPTRIQKFQDTNVWWNVADGYIRLAVSLKI